MRRGGDLCLSGPGAPGLGGKPLCAAGAAARQKELGKDLRSRGQQRADTALFRGEARAQRSGGRAHPVKR